MRTELVECVGLRPEVDSAGRGKKTTIFQPFNHRQADGVSSTWREIIQGLPRRDLIRELAPEEQAMVMILVGD